MIMGIMIAAFIWFVLLALVLLPSGSIKNFMDRRLRGKLTEDRIPLQIMVDHLRSFPELWSVSKDSASFPLTGAKQIYLNRDKEGWTYALDKFDTRETRRLSGYFEQEFKTLLAEENAARESRALLKTFYPELDGTLLLK